jgi:hypothetical protein
MVIGHIRATGFLKARQQCRPGNRRIDQNLRLNAGFSKGSDDYCINAGIVESPKLVAVMVETEPSICARSDKEEYLEVAVGAPISRLPGVGSPRPCRETRSITPEVTTRRRPRAENAASSCSRWAMAAPLRTRRVNTSLSRQTLR